MDPLFDAFRWLSDTPFSIGVRESDSWFSVIETVHVLGLAVMAGSVAVVDLRLLGASFRRQPVAALLAQLLPITWVGFAIMAASGAALFVSEAHKLYGNGAFWAKMALLALAGVNPLVFHATVYRHVADWSETGTVPLQARAAAAFSLLLWSAIIVLGRVIAYYPAGPTP